MLRPMMRFSAASKPFRPVVEGRLVEDPVAVRVLPRRVAGTDQLHRAVHHVHQRAPKYRRFEPCGGSNPSGRFSKSTFRRSSAPTSCCNIFSRPARDLVAGAAPTCSYLDPLALAPRPGTSSVRGASTVRCALTSFCCHQHLGVAQLHRREGRVQAPQHPARQHTDPRPGHRPGGVIVDQLPDPVHAGPRGRGAQHRTGRLLPEPPATSRNAGCRAARCSSTTSRAPAGQPSTRIIPVATARHQLAVLRPGEVEDGLQLARVEGAEVALDRAAHCHPPRRDRDDPGSNRTSPARCEPQPPDEAPMRCIPG